MLRQPPNDFESMALNGPLLPSISTFSSGAAVQRKPAGQGASHLVSKNRSRAPRASFAAHVRGLRPWTADRGARCTVACRGLGARAVACGRRRCRTRS
ncbi:hypothetical protein P4O66_004095 [Electrophorus voltai]|uniref:Uncharacterized protein n=1 Tax=Electrophorus voltai TaxID=2609070 RepID=A0AAD9E3R3_9TELE|nr:hypothetical protein P4O66_004095 [Electrophorus voltai]